MAPCIIITRPLPQAREFAGALQDASQHPLPILIAPLMQIDPVSPSGSLGLARHLIFTSANAVAQIHRLGVDPSATAWCVGNQTAKAAQDAGFQIMNAEGNSDDLVAQVIAARPDGPMLHLHGAHTTGDVADRLRAAGLSCSASVVYRQTTRKADAALRNCLAGSAPVILPLFSARSARLLAESAPIRAPVTVVAISKAVAQAAETIPSIDVILSNFPDKAGMIAATLDAFTGE